MEPNSLPPGFRFSPTHVELLLYYLKRKVMGKGIRDNVISEIDLYKYSPWDLRDMSSLKSGDLKWYFFSSREKKYGNGSRLNRSTEMGHWKTSGKDRQVNYKGRVIGFIRTLIFHRGRPPKGERTDWVMHEYRLEDGNLSSRGIVQDTYVLCQVFQKSGRGPRNGAQYSAPFNENDWNDDIDVEDRESIPCTGLATLEPAIGASVNALPISVCTATPTSQPQSVCVFGNVCSELSDLDLLQPHDAASQGLEDGIEKMASLPLDVQNQWNEVFLNDSDFFSGLEDLAAWKEMGSDKQELPSSSSSYCAVNEIRPSYSIDEWLEVDELDTVLGSSTVASYSVNGYIDMDDLNP